jgi:transcriptional repressor NrdR
MVCIYCHGELSVINSRAQKQRNQTWRRRKCESCGALFTSTEAIDLSRAISVKTSDALQAFSRDTLYISIYESCRHRLKTASDASGLTETVVSALIEKTDGGSLPVEDIIQTVTDTLECFDRAAAVQYAAFHPS